MTVRISPPVRGVTVRAARTGLGLFASRPFKHGATIGQISGRVHHWRVLWRRGGSFLANCFRLGDETYLDPGKGLGRYLNHSCTPNSGVRVRGGKLYLFAATEIGSGQEITIDYSTTIGDDDSYRMRCRCGSRRCRTWVGRFGLLTPAVQRAYLERDMVADVILRTLD